MLYLYDLLTKPDSASVVLAGSLAIIALVVGLALNPPPHHAVFTGNHPEQQRVLQSTPKPMMVRQGYTQDG